MADIQKLPEIRWGILGTGGISTLFVKDLLIAENDPATPVRHIIKAIGTSSLETGKAFVTSVMPGTASPSIYADYNDLYADDEVDIVYIGIPHSFHKGACLSAIAAKKHVLCEKPMAINSSEVNEINTAAREKGVFLMEGVWTRFLPVVKQLQKLIHEEKAIGEVSRMFCDFGCDMRMDSLPPSSRMKNLTLGGGALLDLGVYPLSLSNLILDAGVGIKALRPEVTSSMTIVDGVDYSNVIVVNYPSRKCLGILTASFQVDTREDFCRIEGSRGVITLLGSMAAKPKTIKINGHGKVEKICVFENPGAGYYFEANEAALCILAGKLESAIMPLAETIRMFELMDGIRKANGIVYPQDLQ